MSTKRKFDHQSKEEEKFFSSSSFSSSSSNSLSCLKQSSIVVADTGDFESIKAFTPQDATTNPTLLFQAAQLPAYTSLLDQAISYARQTDLSSSSSSSSSPSSSSSSAAGYCSDKVVESACDKLAVLFGFNILKIVPGVVSTEVDASLSFDTDGSIAKAKRLIQMYAELGIPKERILIKMACTWEGCKAASVLEQQGIHCNMTLLFSKPQAMAAAEANATLISPFVGRILDWHLAKGDGPFVEGKDDPGVKSVTEIYNYYKKHGYQTIIMGASFRNIHQILALSGCDKLTISPKLLYELENDQRPSFGKTIENNNTENEEEDPHKKHKIDLSIDEKTFRWMLNNDAMATEKLAEGIRNFNADLEKLKTFIRQQIITTTHFKHSS